MRFQDALVDINTDDDEVERAEGSNPELARRRSTEDQPQGDDDAGDDQPAFTFNFGRRVDGLYNICVITQRTYIPADLHFSFYEPVSAAQTEVVIPETAFDDLKRRLGVHALHISPYADRAEWSGLLLRLFALAWNAESCCLEATLCPERADHLDDYPLTRDPFVDDGVVGQRHSEVYLPILQFLDEEWKRREREAAAEALAKAATEEEGVDELGRLGEASSESPLPVSPKLNRRRSSITPKASPSPKVASPSPKSSPKTVRGSPSPLPSPMAANYLNEMSSPTVMLPSSSPAASPVPNAGAPSPTPKTPSRGMGMTPISRQASSAFSFTPIHASSPSPLPMLADGSRDTWGQLQSNSARQVSRVSFNQPASAASESESAAQLTEESLQAVAAEPLPTATAVSTQL
jgi:hypothetical protein